LDKDFRYNTEVERYYAYNDAKFFVKLHQTREALMLKPYDDILYAHRKEILMNGYSDFHKQYTNSLKQLLSSGEFRS